MMGQEAYLLLLLLPPGRHQAPQLSSSEPWLQPKLPVLVRLQLAPVAGLGRAVVLLVGEPDQGEDPL